MKYQFFLSVLLLIFFVVTEALIILFFSMIILSFIYYLFIKQVYHKYGRDRQFYTNLMIKFIINPLLAIKRCENFWC